MEAVAKLSNCPYPARKMRLLADLVRGMRVDEAVNILKFHPKKMYATKLEKLIMSAVANWQVKNEDERVEDHELVITTLTVDGARQLKRIQPAPQGRAHRIRKRFNHITVKVNTVNPVEKVVEEDTLVENNVDNTQE